MPVRVPWSERRFEFDSPVGVYPEAIERLRGTPARLEERVRVLPASFLTRRSGRRWTIQENVGHLLDLEALILGRLDDFDRGLEALRAADMTNRATEEARHNERPIGEILAAFRQERGGVIVRLEALAPEDFGRAALHPRLRRTMRVVDLLQFQADHDDYHLATISELAREFEREK